MIEIKEIDNRTSEEYLLNLNFLIKENINLPQNAIDFYINQWSIDRINSQIKNWLFLCAYSSDGRMCGIVLGTPVEGGVGTIIWVLVNKKFQKQQIGTNLFNESMIRYRNKGAHKIKLTVPDKDTVDFYLKQRMDLEGYHKNHWWGKDFYSMGLSIN
jgi:hypothetical protein